MNTLNRILIVLFLLFLVAALTAVFVAPHIILPGVGQWMVDWGTYLGRPDIIDQWLRLLSGILLAFVVNLVLLVFIFMEVRPRRKRFIDVQMVSGGIATVSLTSVEEQLKYKLDGLPGVVRVITKAKAKGKNVHVEADVAITRDARVTQTAEKLVETVQNVVISDMGLQLAGKPEVRLEIINSPMVVPDKSGQKPQVKKPVIPVEAIHTTQTLPPLPSVAADNEEPAEE